jgi:uncharacterized protein (TIGR02217 family)
MSFIETRLLDDLAYGFSGGPRWNTRVVTLRNRFDRRNIEASRPQHRFQGSFDRRDEGVLSTLLESFNGTYGAAYGFRFKNWLDYQATEQQIAVATDGVQTVQLTKTYTFGPQSVVIPIRKPVVPTVQLYADGAPIVASISSSTGLVTFEAGGGAVIAWSGEFDIPVRFETDEFMATIETFGANTIDIALIEDMSA